jgi:phosphoglycolate phosphatase-like HAD superfamily hydrolase
MVKRRRGAFLCFDLDSTLIHADDAHVKAYQKALRSLGLPPVKKKAILKRMGIVGWEILHQLYPYMSCEMITQVVQRHHRYLLRDMKKYVKPIRGVHRALDKLHDAGHTLAIVTNCTHRTMDMLMKAGNINKRLFVARVGNDDVLHPKPAADEIHKAEHLAHLKADYMVGDTIYDLMAARKAKVKGIGVLTGRHSRIKLKKYAPYAILKSVADVPDFIEEDYQK